jgi:3-hydroxyanthranilate 3,4-dioxygenase
MNPFSTYHLKQWVKENEHLFSPPDKTNRLIIHHEEFLVMILRGPNVRLDFHVEPGEEFFYQIEGDIELHVKPDNQRRQILRICEGEIFVCPGNVPHSPRRGDNTWGLVIERRRKAHEEEKFVWYCEKCDGEVLSKGLVQGGIAEQVTRIYEKFNADAGSRTCNKCGYVFPIAPMAERLGFLEAKS